jgi:hypothetical protein
VLAKIQQIERDEEDDADADENGDEEDGAGPLADLKKQAGEIKKGLDKLDRRLRRSADAKGIPGGTYALREVSNAEEIISSTWDRPSPASLEYLRNAEQFFEDVLIDYNKYFDEDVAEFRKNLDAANLELLPSLEPLKLEGDR